MVYACNPSTLRQKDSKFELFMENSVRCCLKEKSVGDVVQCEDARHNSQYWGEKKKKERKKEKKNLDNSQKHTY